MPPLLSVASGSLSYKEHLITLGAHSTQQEVRWHLAQLFPRLAVDQHERATMVTILLEYLTDKSQIVKVCVLQALADFSAQNPALRRQTIAILEQVTSTGNPAVKNRGRKLLHQQTTQSRTARQKMPEEKL